MYGTVLDETIQDLDDANSVLEIKAAISHLKQNNKTWTWLY